MQKHKKYGRKKKQKTRQYDISKGQQPTVIDTKDSEKGENHDSKNDQ
jgi:hypothetical protein